MQSHHQYSTRNTTTINQSINELATQLTNTHKMINGNTTQVTKNEMDSTTPVESIKSSTALSPEQIHCLQIEVEY